MKLDDKIVSRRSTAHWKEINDGREALVLSLEDGSYFEINESALLVWKLMDGTKTVSVLVDKLCRSYQVSRDVAAKDVKAVLVQLKRFQLVDFRDEAS